MRKSIFWLVLISFISLALPVHSGPYVPRKLPPLRIIEDFSDSSPGKFPKSFRTYPFQRGKAESIYLVAEENGNRFLHAHDDRDVSVQTFKKFFWEAARWPHFSWRWRAITLPQGAAENDRKSNDSACGVYVVFGGYKGKALKYVWSTTLPVGSVIKKESDPFYFLVKESGSQNLGNWQTVSVNIVEDYKKVFGEAPKNEPDGFGLLTDGNATHTTASCDYDDFKISETR